MKDWLLEIDKLYDKYVNTPEGNGLEFLNEVWSLFREIVNRDS